MAKGEKPAYKVYVSKKAGDKNMYFEVGSAWHVANDGISIKLHALPLDGSLVCFPPKEE